MDLLGEAKVRDFNVPVCRDQEVLWFQVPVGNSVLVEILKSQHNFSDVEESNIIRKEVLSAEQAKDLSALYVFKGKVHMCTILEALMPIFMSDMSKNKVKIGR